MANGCGGMRHVTGLSLEAPPDSVKLAGIDYPQRRNLMYFQAREFVQSAVVCSLKEK